MVPDGWKVCQVGEIARVIRGASPRPKGDPRYYGGKVPRLMVSDVTRDGKYVTPKTDFLTEEGAKLSRPMPAGSLTVVCSGTVGVPSFLAVDACIHDGFLALDNISDTCDKEYLYYTFSRLQQDFDSAATHGGVFTNLTTEILRTFKIPLPTVPEQKKIAEILSSVDEAIASTQAVIDQTRKVKQGLLQQLLTRGIGHTKFKESAIGEIPAHWKVKKVGDIGRVIRGASPRPKGDPKYYGGNVPRLMVADVTRDGKYVTPAIDFLTEEGAKLSRLMPAGSLTIVCSGTVGVPSILSIDACIHDGFLALDEILENCHVEYLYYFFSTRQREFDSSATHGGVFTNLTTSILKDFKLPIPPLEEQEKIVEILASIDNQITQLKIEKDTLEKIKSGLMQDLLTGRVRVGCTS